MSWSEGDKPSQTSFSPILHRYIQVFLVLSLATKQARFTRTICGSLWPVTARGSSGRTPYLDLFFAVPVGFSALCDILFLSSFMLVSANTPCRKGRSFRMRVVSASEWMPLFLYIFQEWKHFNSWTQHNKPLRVFPENAPACPISLLP